MSDNVYGLKKIEKGQVKDVAPNDLGYLNNGIQQYDILKQEMEEFLLPDFSSGYLMRCKKGGKSISNFANIIPVKFYTLVFENGSGAENAYEMHFRVHNQVDIQVILFNESEMNEKKIIDIFQKQLHCSFYGKRSNKEYATLFVNFLTAMIAMSEVVKIDYFAGWDAFMYRRYNLDANSQYMSPTIASRNFELSGSLSELEAYEETLNMMRISKNPKPGIVLFLLSDFSLMYALFLQLKIEFNAIVNIRGVDSPISDIAMLYFQHFYRSKLQMPLSFLSPTETIQEKLYIGRDMATLINGETIASTKKEQALQNINTDMLINYVSNNTVLKKDCFDFSNKGLVVATSNSLLSRVDDVRSLFTVEFNSTDIDMEIMRKYQKNPLALSTHQEYLIRYIENNREKVLGIIADTYDSYLKAPMHKFEEHFSRSFFAILMSIVEVLEDYSKYLGFSFNQVCSVARIDIGYSVAEIVKKNESNCDRDIIPDMFIELINKIGRECGFIKVVNSSGNSKHVGLIQMQPVFYISNDYAIIDRTEFEKNILSSMPVDYSKDIIYTMLIKAGVIIADKDRHTKKVDVYFLHDVKQYKRMVLLNIKKFDNEDGNIFEI